MGACGRAHSCHYFLAEAQVWAGGGEAEILSCWEDALGTSVELLSLVIFQLVSQKVAQEC